MSVVWLLALICWCGVYTDVCQCQLLVYSFCLEITSKLLAWAIKNIESSSAHLYDFMCVCYIFRGDVMSSTPADGFHGRFRTQTLASPLLGYTHAWMRKAHWAENRASWEGIGPPVSELECARGKKYFQPSLLFIDSSKQEKCHIHRTRPRGHFVEWNVHFAHSYVLLCTHNLSLSFLVI